MPGFASEANRDPAQAGDRVLRFSFSAVNDKLETLDRECEICCHLETRSVLRRHPDLFPEAALRDILEPPPIATRWRSGPPRRRR